jgi:CrtC N-terminal lipocalin domain
MSRVMDKPEDFAKLGINPTQIEAWEDGRRDTSAPGHAEIWYLDCHFDDKSTLVLGFRPKSVDQVDRDGDNPNVAINYTHADGTTFYDYRLYDTSQVSARKDRCDLRFGPSTLTGDWKTYDVHIEAEPDKEVLMEGKHSTKHHSALDLHFEAQVEAFRPGTGYLTFGPDDANYYNFICVTKLTVSGQVTIDGETKQVTGSAYYNHQWMNISPVNAFHHWLWGRQNVGKYSVMIFDMVAAERFGLDQIPLFTIDDEQGHRVMESISADDMSVRVIDSYVQEQTGKRYPKTVRYTFDQGDTHAEYTISEPQEINIIDIYGDAPEPVRAKFDQLRLRPTYTRYLAQAELVLTRNGQSETITGPILYEFNSPGIENPDAHLF